MARPGPRSVPKYSDEFKLTAVQLSQLPGMQVRTVSSASDAGGLASRGHCARFVVVRTCPVTCH
jgi:hypothetical protein